MERIEGNIVDIHNREIFPGSLLVEDGRISSIERNQNKYNHFICPGFVDAHVHIESSMLCPVEFSKTVIRKGTIGIVNDPHEIANVMGMQGIEFMLKQSEGSLIKTFFTIPSCVPSTSFDHAGSIVTSDDVEKLAETGKFVGLSEVMNVPGVIYEDKEVCAKLNVAHRYNLRIDGHAPGLSGEDLCKYVSAGISTDHECVSLAEAQEKISAGMKILIREGSAARNYAALKNLISLCPDKIMFCTDDSHPGDLLKYGEIDKIARKALHDGFDLFDVLRIASLNPILHYGLKIGTLCVGDPADFVIFRDLSDFEVLSVYIDGYEKFNLTSNFNSSEENKDYPIEPINNFNCSPITADDIKKAINGEIISIEVTDGEIVTGRKDFHLYLNTGNFESDLERDILKIVYLNRYENKKPQIGYITGVGLKKGAFSSSISHDSHNIIAVGCHDADIVDAINAVIETKGGLVVKNEREILNLPLPIAGIMTDKSAESVAEKWDKLKNELTKMECKLSSPFMTLSFMSLIVIPELKIGEYGLFEFKKFNFIE